MKLFARLQLVWNTLANVSQQRVMNFAAQLLTCEDEYAGLSMLSGLSEYGNQYTSLELQKKARDGQLKGSG